MKAVCTALFAWAIACVFAQSALSASAPSYKERVLYSFGPDSAGPVGVIKAKGAFALYGAAYGGANEAGIVYSLDLNTNAETVLYSFCSQPNCADGADASSPMHEMDGVLYGTTQNGGVKSCGLSGLGCGVLFSLDPDTGAEKVVYTFCSQQNCADGAGPSPNLLKANGLLYGTTFNGGDTYCTLGCGTVYSIDLTTGAEKVLYAFCSQQQACTDGVYPVGSLLRANGVLYGTTALGGVGGYIHVCEACGTIFSLDMKTGVENVLYSFCTQQNCADGAAPSGGLIEVDGLWYGTTFFGGNLSCNAGGGCGTVFSFDPKTHAEKVLYAFSFLSGWGPSADLIYVDGVLYGTTFGGGIEGCYGLGCGVVFSIDPKTGAETVVYSFCSQKNCADGSDPTDLITVNGRLYGTTGSGGIDNNGTVFELKKR